MAVRILNSLFFRTMVWIWLCCMWPLSGHAQQGLRLIKTSRDFSYVGPSLMPHEVFVADGHQLLRIDSTGRTLWSMKLESGYPVRELVLSDSQAQKVLIQHNSHGAWHVAEAPDIGMRLYSLQKKEKLKDLHSELAAWPGAMGPGVVVNQNRFSSDGQTYYTYRSRLYKLPDGPEKLVYGSTVTAMAFSRGGDTVAAGLRDGRILLYRGGSLDSVASIATGTEPVLHLALTDEYLIYSTDDTLLHLLPLRQRAALTLRCEKPNYHIPFLLSADGSSLCYIGRYGMVMWQNLSDLSRRDTLHFRLPVFTRYWGSGTAHPAQWYLMSEDYQHKYVYHVHLDSLRAGRRSAMRQSGMQQARIRAFSELVSRSMLSHTDFEGHELMVNQIPDSYNPDYFDPVYSSENRDISLFAKDKHVLVFHMPSGRILKQFLFPVSVARYAISGSGRWLAFYFNADGQSHLSGGMGAQIVTYDLARKTGETYALSELFPGFSASSSDTLRFTKDELYLYTGVVDRYGKYLHNALRLAEQRFEQLTEWPDLQPVRIYPKDSFLRTAAAAVLTGDKELNWMSFRAGDDRISLSMYNNRDLHLNLRTLRTEWAWDPVFSGERIYNYSLSNPLWKQLGIIPDEYDFSYNLYGTQVLNDSLIVFTERDRSDVTKSHVHVADIKNKRIVFSIKNTQAFAKAESALGNIPPAVYARSGIINDVREDLYVADENRLKFTRISLNRIIRNFKKENVLLLRYSKKFNTAFNKKILKKNTWVQTRKEYLNNELNLNGQVDYLCRSGQSAILLRHYDRAFLYDYKRHKLIGKPLFFGDFIKTAAEGADGYLYAGTERGIVYRWRPGSDTLLKYAETSPGLLQLQITPGRLFALCKNNRMHVIGRDSGREQARILAYMDDAGQPVLSIHTPQLYYHAEKQGIHALHISSTGMQLFNAGQFDLMYNRPDKVLQALGEDGPQIGLYRQAREKRLRKLNIPEPEYLDNLPVPKLSVALPAGWKDTTQTRDFELHLTYEDSLYPAGTIQVLHNNVPLLGRDGMKAGDHQREWKIPVRLTPGANELVCTAANSTGMSSWGSSLKTVYKPAQRIPAALYVITLGVSRYKDTAWNLKYAAKDARDLAGLLDHTARELYDTVYQWVLTDTAVTRENLNRIRRQLLQSHPQDAVMLSFAGHGTLDTGLNYFLGFPEIRFDRPSEGGLAYEELEKVLDSIPALHKALLIDACHSGEVDKDDYTGWNERGVVGRPVGRGARVQAAVKQEGVSVSGLTSELFADLRKGTGATVLAASGGMEFAMEGGDIENGLFTWCVKTGLDQGKADDNGDGQIWLSELQAWVTEEVDKRSGGRQKPTARIQNRSADIRLK